MSSSTISHSTLGSLQGLEFPTTTQYRNLPYAHFQGRYKDAILHEGPIDSGSGVYDATKWGPLCPQVSNGIKFDFALAGVELPYEDYIMDEEKGLNVVVTVPKGVTGGQNIPVVVWVHGGYWVVGGNSWPQYDLQNLVAASVRLGKPVIGVAFNYRLSVLGLLASQELGIKGNFALKDQILSFQWVRKHIAGFGGDPENVTAMGESAGAMALSALLQISTPLFQKALVMSGSATLRPSKTEALQEALYQDIVKQLGLVESISEERTEVMRTISPKEMLSKLPPLIHVGPSLDSELLTDVVTLDTIAAKTTPNWCNELVIGDCLHDASCFKTRVLCHPNNAEYFIKAIDHALPPPEASQVITAYGLSASDPAAKSLIDCMELLGDLRWYLPVLHTIEEAPRSKKVSRYHFHQPNQFDCQWKGLAAHLFDITLLLHNHTDFLTAEEAILGDDMATRLFNLAHGNGFMSAQEESGNGKKVVVWGPNGNSNVVSDAQYDEGMRKGRGQLLRSLGWEACEKLANTIQFGIPK